ncbi:MAG: GTP cyclohydrolase I FolE [Candidatus Methanomethylophilaceae archaeon]|nr:GTP cyclohydrolase I FolE [Candidatus Methanomethylophilaceae archaeon]
MVKKIDTERIKAAVKEIILALNDNPERPGLIETPDRVARMYEEVYEGMCYTNDEIAAMFDKTFEEIVTDDMVIIGDIPVFSHCEHHLALMYDMKVHVAYIPKGRVIGLSKVGRIADMVAKRLQIQERIGQEIADILEKVLQTQDIAVIIEGKHACMTSRGVKKDSVTKTSTIRGLFRENAMLRAEMLNLLNHTN